MSRRLLCLHGWGGSKDDFEVAKFTQIKGKATCAQAPHNVPHDEFAAFLESLGHPAEIIEALRDFDHRSWREKTPGAPDEHLTVASQGTAAADDDGNLIVDAQLRVPLAQWSAALDSLVALWKRDGPFDGVAGFSQGGLLATLLLAAATQMPERYACFASLRFAVLVGVPDRVADKSAAIAADVKCVELSTDKPLAVPLFALRGTRDTLLQNDKEATAVSLERFYRSAETISYDGAHQVPYDRALFGKLNDSIDAALAST